MELLVARGIFGSPVTVPPSDPLVELLPPLLLLLAAGEPTTVGRPLGEPVVVAPEVPVTPAVPVAPVALAVPVAPAIPMVHTVPFDWVGFTPGAVADPDAGGAAVLTPPAGGFAVELGDCPLMHPLGPLETVVISLLPPFSLFPPTARKSI